MSGCARTPELEAALDGRLDPEATRQVLAHARGCLRCREARDELAQLARLAAALPPIVKDELRVRRLRAGLQGKALMGDPRPASAHTRWVAAAALALALGGTALLWRAKQPPSRPASASAATGDRSDARHVDLAGSGTLWPDPSTQVIVRTAGHDTRIELWQGRITLQVNHRAVGERFVVHTTDGEVEVRGTRFSVQADQGHLQRVDVVEGLVAVRRTGDPERMLAAGTHLLLPLIGAAPARPPEERSAAEPASTAAPARPTVDPGQWFREGSFAYARGDHTTAERALGRFLTSTRTDPRREDARYLRVLSLHALGRTDLLCHEARGYGREFPRGLRQSEVVLTAVTALAAEGRCDEATDFARAMPTGASPRMHSAMADALRCVPPP